MWAASTALASFGDLATDRRTPIPHRITPALDVQSATAFGGSIASPLTASNQTNQSVSQVSAPITASNQTRQSGSGVTGPQSGQTAFDQRLRAETEGSRAMRERLDL